MTADGRAETCATCSKPEGYKCDGVGEPVLNPDGTQRMGPDGPTMAWSQRPCKFAGMDPDLWRVLKLYERCKARRALPFPGGITDQPEEIMRLFDVIDAEMNAHQRTKSTPMSPQGMVD